MPFVQDESIKLPEDDQAIFTAPDMGAAAAIYATVNQGWEVRFIDACSDRFAESNTLPLVTEFHGRKSAHPVSTTAKMKAIPCRCGKELL